MTTPPDSDPPATRTRDWTAARLTMVESQLRTVGVSDPRVLLRFARVERERFVPVEAHALAYADALVPLPGGRAMNPPMATALLIQAAEPLPSDKALLIGDSTGYTAAVLAPLVGRLTVVDDAAANGGGGLSLEALGAATVVRGPADEGHEVGAPYDLIVIDGAVERMPERLVAQLVPGGRMAAGVVDAGVSRLSAGHRAGDSLALRPLAEVMMAVLPAFAAPRDFVF